MSHEPLRRFEAELQRSGLAWTILRPGGFDSNAFGWVPGVRAQRTVAAADRSHVLSNGELRLTLGPESAGDTETLVAAYFS